jgi:DNA invertase Pin-like site-specific DNA recombinase
VKGVDKLVNYAYYNLVTAQKECDREKLRRDGTMGKVLGYIRGDLNGIDENEQREIIAGYCEERGHEVLKWFEGDFNEVVFGDDIQTLPVTMVIVANNYAVSDDVSEYFAYKGILRKKGCELVPVNENYGGYNLYANMMNELVTKMADLERNNSMKRADSGRKAKAAKGGYTGGQPPMGYKAVNGQLVIEPREAEIVRFIFERKRAGKTMMGTVDALNEAGYKTRGGKKFLISSVQSVWNNEKFYEGWYKYGKDGDWVRGQHEAIIEDRG